MKFIVKHYPLISYYVFALVLSGVILALLYATGLAETLFFLGTFGPGLAAILVTALISGGAGVNPGDRIARPLSNGSHHFLGSEDSNSRLMVNY